MADLKSMLAKASKNWEETVETAAKGNYTAYPDGKYVGLLVGAELKESKGKPATKTTEATNPAWMILTSFLIQEGDNEGDTYRNYTFLFDQEMNVSTQAVKRLEALSGQDPADLDITEIEAILEDAVSEAPVFEFILKTNNRNGNEYQNQYLNKRLEDYEATGPEEEEETPPAKKDTGKTVQPKKESPTSSTSPKKAPKVVEPDPEDEEEEETSDWPLSEFEKGDEVTWTVTTGKGKAAKSETKTGTIHLVGEDSAEVKTGGTAKKPILEVVALSELQPVVEEEEDDEDEEDTETDEEESEAGDENSAFTEGDEVTFDLDGEEKTGIILSVDEDKQVLEVEVKEGKKKTKVEVNFEDVYGDQDLAVGDRVEFSDPKNAKKQLQGEVTEIADDETWAMVKVDGTAKAVKVSTDDLLILGDE